MVMLFRLESGLARADVSRQGGELQAWYIGGQNLLWERDPQWWDQSAPNRTQLVALIYGSNRAGTRLVA
jgi:hypothetical protein